MSAMFFLSLLGVKYLGGAIPVVWRGALSCKVSVTEATMSSPSL